jgi:hypothetical protein
MPNAKQKKQKKRSNGNVIEKSGLSAEVIILLQFPFSNNVVSTFIVSLGCGSCIPLWKKNSRLGGQEPKQVLGYCNYRAYPYVCLRCQSPFSPLMGWMWYQP